MISLRPFRFRLRTALLGMTVVALCLGHQDYVWQQQAEALSQLQGMGGQVHDQLPHSPFWQSKLVPSDAALAGSVTEIGFMGSNVGDPEIDELVRCAKSLPSLERIDFAGTRLSFDGELVLKERLPHITIHRTEPIFHSTPDYTF